MHKIVQIGRFSCASRRHMRLSYISGEVLPPFCGGDACVISETEKDSIQETREEERR